MNEKLWMVLVLINLVSGMLNLFVGTTLLNHVVGFLNILCVCLLVVILVCGEHEVEG